MSSILSNKMPSASKTTFSMKTGEVRSDCGGRARGEGGAEAWVVGKHHVDYLMHIGGDSAQLCHDEIDDDSRIHGWRPSCTASVVAQSMVVLTPNSHRIGGAPCQRTHTTRRHRPGLLYLRVPEISVALSIACGAGV